MRQHLKKLTELGRGIRGLRISWQASAILAAAFFCAPLQIRAEWVWVEGEDAQTAEVSRHPWWYDKVNTELLSGGDFLSHFTKEGPGRAEYQVKAPKAGKYDLWVRANPRKAGMSYSVNNGKMHKIDFESDPREVTNIAADEKPDLRFLAWIRAGEVKLVEGENKVVFIFEGKDHHHGSLDAFLLTNEEFEPRGILKPDEDEEDLASGNASSTNRDTDKTETKKDEMKNGEPGKPVKPREND